MRLAVLAWAILFQISSGQKVKVPYGTEWQLGLSEYIVLYFGISYHAYLLIKV